MQAFVSSCQTDDERCLKYVQICICSQRCHLHLYSSFLLGTMFLTFLIVLYFPTVHMQIIFSFRFNDIEFEEDSGIPTLPFLESCYAIVPVLGRKLHYLFVSICLK